MNKVRLFHGTSWESAQKIIKNGFKYGHKVWDVSSPTGIYFMDERYDVGNDFADSESIDAKELPAFEFALEAGQIAAAYRNSQSDKVVIFELDGDEHIMGGFCRDVSADEVVENSWECDARIVNSLIWCGSARLTIHTIHNGYEPGCRYLYLANLSREQMALETNKEIDIQMSVHDMLQNAAYLFAPDITRELMYVESVPFAIYRDWVINEEHRWNRD